MERVSASQYKDHFILKGGMLVASLLGINVRATMDIVALGGQIVEVPIMDLHSCTAGILVSTIAYHLFQNKNESNHWKNDG